MPLRLLQLFMGLPWVGTYSAALTAHQRVKFVRDERRRESKGTKRLQDALGAVEGSLDQARRRARPGPNRVALRAELARLDIILVEHRRQADMARERLDALQRRSDGVQAELAAARNALQQLRDDRAAGVVFRALRPVCCPSCEAGIDRARFEAAEAIEVCALCGERHAEADPEAEDRLKDLENDVADAGVTAARLRSEVNMTAQDQRRADARVADVQRSIARVEGELTVKDESELDYEIRALEAQRKQLVELIALDRDEGVQTDREDERVLAAAVDVTKSLNDGLAKEVLAEISQELTSLSRKFGVQNIESMTLGTGGALKIVQGDTVTSFTKLSPGEMLRTRVAAALAVIEVARRRQFGRHPGLLVLDSPAGQEMTEVDFAALLASVQDAVRQADDVQVIVGAVARPELLAVVPCEHVEHAFGEDFLF